MPDGHGAVRLHLGCGMTRQEGHGWVNCDYIQTDYADLVFDVQQRWPLADSSVHEIYAAHMLEHLTDYRTFFKEAWRVLIPNGQMFLRLPHGANRAAWWDVEHVRPWFAECFAFLQPGYADSIRNPEHSEWTAFFGVHSADQRISGKFAPVLRWKIGRHLLLPWIDNIENALEELHVYLFALKDQEAIQRYRERNPGNCVPSRYVIYEHHYYRHGTTSNETTGVRTMVLADVDHPLIAGGLGA
jgi:SAM-dependent methyltransferase